MKRGREPHYGVTPNDDDVTPEVKMSAGTRRRKWLDSIFLGSSKSRYEDLMVDVYDEEREKAPCPEVCPVLLSQVNIQTFHQAVQIPGQTKIKGFTNWKSMVSAEEKVFFVCVVGLGLG